MWNEILKHVLKLGDLAEQFGYIYIDEILSLFPTT